MTPIKIRSPRGREYSFDSQIEFLRALEGGRITSAWEIYHEWGARWMPIMRHPLFRASAEPAEVPGLWLDRKDPHRRSGESVV